MRRAVRQGKRRNGRLGLTVADSDLFPTLTVDRCYEQKECQMVSFAGAPKSRNLSIKGHIAGVGDWSSGRKPGGCPPVRAPFFKVPRIVLTQTLCSGPQAAATVPQDMPPPPAPGPLPDGRPPPHHDDIEDEARCPSGGVPRDDRAGH